MAHAAKGPFAGLYRKFEVTPYRASANPRRRPKPADLAYNVGRFPLTANGRATGSARLLQGANAKKAR